MARNQKTFGLTILFSAMALGTAWAVRGKFGHEQGAAWAGAIGALSILLLAKREDWYPKFLISALAAAFGWGLGGMMSYGRIVGYGRSTDFLNVTYGFTMLFIIGALYGLLGGGFFGLALTDSKENRVKWHILIIEMTAWALIIYGFLVNQLGWLMTPPRSELWAACLGMGIALVWFLVRNNYHSALRVAVYAGFGAGFGFAFGNFLQVIGNSLNVPFSMWNVMEYSIGFFGGGGMAYGTFTSSWAKSTKTQSRQQNLIPIFLLLIFIPFIIWQQSFETERIQKMLANLAVENVDFWTVLIGLLAVIPMIIFAIYSWRAYYPAGDKKFEANYRDVQRFFLIYFGIYIFLSWLITGSVIRFHLPEQWLYLVNFGILLYFVPRQFPGFFEKKINSFNWLQYFLLLLLIIALLALFAVNSHDEVPGSHLRFE